MPTTAWRLTHRYVELLRFLLVRFEFEREIVGPGGLCGAVAKVAAAVVVFCVQDLQQIDFGRFECLPDLLGLGAQGADALAQMHQPLLHFGAQGLLQLRLDGRLLDQLALELQALRYHERAVILFEEFLLVGAAVHGVDGVRHGVGVVEDCSASALVAGHMHQQRPRNHRMEAQVHALRLSDRRQNSAIDEKCSLRDRSL